MEVFAPLLHAAQPLVSVGGLQFAHQIVHQRGQENIHARLHLLPIRLFSHRHAPCSDVQRHLFRATLADLLRLGPHLAPRGDQRVVVIGLL